MRASFSQTLWVSLGSAIGASVRWSVGVVQSGAEVVPAVPWDTLGINVAGSALIGLYAAISGTRGPLDGGQAQHLFVMAGFCGGFTTFSLFCAEVLLLLDAGEVARATVLLLVSTLAWLGGAWIGYRCGGRFVRSGT